MIRERQGTLALIEAPRGVVLGVDDDSERYDLAADRSVESVGGQEAAGALVAATLIHRKAIQSHGSRTARRDFQSGVRHWNPGALTKEVK